MRESCVACKDGMWSFGEVELKQEVANFNIGGKHFTLNMGKSQRKSTKMFLATVPFPLKMHTF